MMAMCGKKPTFKKAGSEPGFFSGKTFEEYDKCRHAGYERTGLSGGHIFKQSEKQSL
jgi:hypothetical protein